VIATSSTMMLNSLARCVRLSRTYRSATGPIGIPASRMQRCTNTPLQRINKQRAHRSRNLVSLRQQLLCVVLRYYSLHDLIADGRQHTLVPVRAKVLHRKEVA